MFTLAGMAVQLRRNTHLNALGRTAEADNLRASALMLYPGEPLLTVSAARKVAATLERKPSS